MTTLTAELLVPEIVRDLQSIAERQRQASIARQARSATRHRLVHWWHAAAPVARREDAAPTTIAPAGSGD